jgi:hypothetical protein
LNREPLVKGENVLTEEMRKPSVLTDIHESTPELGPRLSAGRTAEVFVWKDSQVLKLFYDWGPQHWSEQEISIGMVMSTKTLERHRRRHGSGGDRNEYPGYINERHGFHPDRTGTCCAGDCSLQEVKCGCSLAVLNSRRVRTAKAAFPPYPCAREYFDLNINLYLERKRKWIVSSLSLGLTVELVWQ